MIIYTIMIALGIFTIIDSVAMVALVPPAVVGVIPGILLIVLGRKLRTKKLEQYNEKQEAESKTGERRMVIFTRMGESRRNTMKATLSVDGEKKNYVLSNKKAIVAMDYNAHELSSVERAEEHNPFGGGGESGLLPYTFHLTIPKGEYDYRFQMELTNGPFTALRPYVGEEPPMVEVSLCVGFLATMAIYALLDEEIREKLRSTKNSAIQIALEKEGWRANIFAPNIKETVLDEKYAEYGDFFGVRLSNRFAQENACQEDMEAIFANYLQWMPDYKRIGKNLLRFAETPVESTTESDIQ